MPRAGVVTCTRPDFEVVVRMGSLALQHAIDYILDKAMDIEDLKGVSAVRGVVLDSLTRRDPIWFFGVGHGDENVFTGQELDHIFWTCNCAELSGRVVYLLSCITGAALGPDIISKDGRCYIGYTKTFGFAFTTLDDPLYDPYARGFFEPVLEIIYKLADGKTSRDAFYASLDKWNYWIDYWSRSTDPAAPEIVELLIWDRDAQILLGDGDAKVRFVPPPISPLWLMGAWGTVMTTGQFILTAKERK